MKKSLPLILTVIVLLAGCSRPLDKAGVLKKMENNQSKVESYQLDLGMNVDVKTSDGQKDYSEMELSADIQAEKEAYHMTMENDDAKKEIVIKADKAYLKDGDDSWEDLDIKEAKALIVQTNYETFTKMIQSVSDDLTLKTEDKDYVLTYEGNDKKLYKMLQRYYNVSFSGVDFEEDGTINLDARVDKKTLQLKELSFVLTAVNDDGKVVMEITMELDQFNAIKEIKLPDLDDE